jgi:hypothetical protein
MTRTQTLISNSIRGKFVKGDGSDVDDKDFTGVTNNILLSLLSECNVSLNGTNVTQAGELYNYRSYLETILNYGSDAAASPLMNAFWYLDNGDMLRCVPIAADVKKRG